MAAIHPLPRPRGSDLDGLGWVLIPRLQESKGSPEWESMAPERCVTDMAYEMRLVLQGIYGCKDAGVASQLSGNWCAWVRAMREQTGDLLESKARVARMVEGLLEGILAQWTRGLTIAFMKGLKNLFSAAKRRAREYRSVKDRTAMLYFVAGKLTQPRARTNSYLFAPVTLIHSDSFRQN